MKLGALKKEQPAPAKAEEKESVVMFDVPTGSQDKKESAESKAEQPTVDVEVKNATAPKEPAQVVGEIKLQRVEWFDDRYYYCQHPDGREGRFPSSTHILGVVKNHALVRWQMEVGAEEAGRRLREAGDRGTRIHDAIEKYLNGGAVIYNPFNRPQYSPEEVAEIRQKFNNNVAILERQEEYWQVIKFTQWVKEVDPGVVATERMVCSFDYGYAGTLDYLFDIQEGHYKIAGREPLFIKGGLWLADEKSSNDVHESYNLQVASYVKAYEEMFPELAGKINGALIIHTNAKTRTGIEGLNTILRTREQIEEDFDHFKDILRVWKWNNPTEKPVIRDFPSIVSLKI